MKRTIHIVSLFMMTFASLAHGNDETSSTANGHGGKWALEGFYGFSSVSPSDLNSARQNFIWNSTAPSTGSFSKLSYFGGTLGRRFGNHLKLSVGYEQQYQALGRTDIGAGMTVADYFVFNPVLLLLEVPFQGKHFGFSFGGGVGYALNYEFHQQYSGTHEDITYKSHPIVLRGRVTLSYAFTQHFAIFAEGKYDKVSAASLAADKDYQATANGAAISTGTTFKDASGNAVVKADMSGVRYGLGLRVTF